MLKLRIEQILIRIIQMSFKRLHFVLLLLIIGCQQAGAVGDGGTSPSESNLVNKGVDKQLEINRVALFNGETDKIRVDAATIMLTEENSAARQIVLGALSSGENKAACQAVCKALSQSRTLKDGVKIAKKEDFIKPLFSLVSGDDTAIAKLASEAALIFDYEEIYETWEKMIEDKKLGLDAKSNLIYALRVRPDKKAMLKLMDLLEHKDTDIAGEAEKTLISMGIPVGKNAKERKRNKDELERKSTEDFLWDWKIRLAQEGQMRQLRKELGWWQEQYLQGLEKVYVLSDENGQVEVLVNGLSSSKSAIRLWALEKVEQRRKGTKSELPDKLGPVLIGMVSDSDKEVRLKTAGLLSMMGYLNSAEKLLEQLKVEQDGEVQMELFSALGGACYYAFLPNSEIKISPEIRKQTLEYALVYLSEEDAKRVQKGAEVIKKLLERDGLSPLEVDKYLSSLAGRYEKAANGGDGKLREELLNIMSGLCAQGIYKTKAGEFFKPFFKDVLSDKSDLIRKTAVDGLIYINKTDALKLFRKDLALINDNNVEIRKSLISLAGEVGDKEDLIWLVDKIGKSTEGELAWDMMLSIFNLKSSDATVLADWLDRFSLQTSKFKLSDEQMLSFLLIAERKAVGEKKVEMLGDVRSKLVEIYKRKGNFEEAAKYLGKMRESTVVVEEKRQITAELLKVYLIWKKIKAATSLVENSLHEGDLGPKSLISVSIDDYLKTLPTKEEAALILGAFVKIKAGEVRPQWQEQLKQWNKEFVLVEEPNKPQEAEK